MKKILTLFSITIWKFELSFSWTLEEYVKTDEVIEKLIKND